MSRSSNADLATLPTSFLHHKHASNLQSHRKLGQNQLAGSLPGEWASNNAFQSLTELDVSANKLEGDLPDSYGAQGSFPGLQLLRLGSNGFTGGRSPCTNRILTELEVQDPAGFGEGGVTVNIVHTMLVERGVSCWLGWDRERVMFSMWH